jgi:SOS-response transcriptional repressor LexA
MTDLTAQQARALSFIKAFSEENGYSPTLREIGNHMSISAVSALAICRELELRRKIERLPSKPRGIRILDPHKIELNPEIFEAIRSYARKTSTSVKAAANQLLRDALGAA